MFFIGDRVKLVTERWGEDSIANPEWGGSHGYIQGTVVNVLDRYNCDVEWDSGCTRNYTFNELELATPIPKFNIGDRVKLITDRWGDIHANPVWGGASGEVIGTIVHIEDCWCDVDWDNEYSNNYQFRDIEVLTKTHNIEWPEDLFEL